MSIHRLVKRLFGGQTFFEMGRINNQLAILTTGAVVLSACGQGEYVTQPPLDDVWLEGEITSGKLSLKGDWPDGAFPEEVSEQLQKAYPGGVLTEFNTPDGDEVWPVTWNETVPRVLSELYSVQSGDIMITGNRFTVITDSGWSATKHTGLSTFEYFAGSFHGMVHDLGTHWSDRILYHRNAQSCQALFDHHSYLMDLQYDTYSAIPSKSVLNDIEQIGSARELCDPTINVVVYSPSRETPGDRRNKANAFVTHMSTNASGSPYDSDLNGMVSTGLTTTLPLPASLQAKLDRGEYVVRFELSWPKPE